MKFSNIKKFCLGLGLVTLLVPSVAFASDSNQNEVKNNTAISSERLSNNSKQTQVIYSTSIDKVINPGETYTIESSLSLYGQAHILYNLTWEQGIPLQVTIDFNDGRLSFNADNTGTFNTGALIGTPSLGSHMNDLNFINWGNTPMHLTGTVEVIQ